MRRRPPPATQGRRARARSPWQAAGRRVGCEGRRLRDRLAPRDDCARAGPCRRPRLPPGGPARIGRRAAEEPRQGVEARAATPQAEGRAGGGDPAAGRGGAQAPARGGSALELRQLDRRIRRARGLVGPASAARRGGGAGGGVGPEGHHRRRCARALAPIVPRVRQAAPSTERRHHGGNPARLRAPAHRRGRGGRHAQRLLAALGLRPGAAHPGSRAGPAGAALFEDPLFMSWIPEEDALRSFALKVDEIAVSQLFIDEAQRRQAFERAAEEAALAYFTPRRRAIYSRRLNEMAHVLASAGRIDAARTALAVSRALEKDAMNPFCRALFTHALAERLEQPAAKSPAPAAG